MRPFTRLFILATMALPLLTAAQQAVSTKSAEFSSHFLSKTMRLDYYHTGNDREEQFTVDQVVSDGPWAGSRTVLIDALRRGAYLFEVTDKVSGTLLYSRGYASVFGEWQSTPEASQTRMTFSESVRFPWPVKPVVVTVFKRDAENKFQKAWSCTIDPASNEVNKADLKPSHRSDVLQMSGDPAVKFDLVILGDGYAANEMEKFRADAKRLTGVLMSSEPFASRKKEFNIRAIETPGGGSGVRKPQPGVHKRTPLSVSYGAFGSERYALTFDNKTVRDIAAEVPYDFMIILINEKTYGGGGIYNLYTTVSVDNKYAGYIMVHELGHGLAGLADEYYTSSVAYEAPKNIIEPWEPNITALLDKDNLKWKDLVKPGTPLPTPWNKEEFDRYGYRVQKERDSLRAAKVPENVMEELFLRQYKQEDAWFAKEKYPDAVGAFNGAGYVQYGLYRPQLDCIMFTRHMRYCRVCQRSIEQVIDQYNR